MSQPIKAALFHPQLSAAGTYNPTLTDIFEDMNIEVKAVLADEEMVLELAESLRVEGPRTPDINTVFIGLYAKGGIIPQDSPAFFLAEAFKDLPVAVIFMSDSLLNKTEKDVCLQRGIPLIQIQHLSEDNVLDKIVKDAREAKFGPQDSEHLPNI